MNEKDQEKDLYDYLEVRIMKGLMFTFIEDHLMNLGPLERPCYFNPKENSNLIYVPKQTYERVSPLVDSVFISGTPVRVNIQKYLQYLVCNFYKKPKVGLICTTPIETGDFLIKETNPKTETAVLENIKTKECITTPYKYINL